MTQQIQTHQIDIDNTALTSASGSIAWDMSLGDNFTHTFTENTTLVNPEHKTVGKSGFIFLTQHASSPKTLAFGTDYVGPSATLPTVTATNSAVDVLQYVVLPSEKVLITSALAVAVPA